MADNLQYGVATVETHVTDYLKVLSRRRWIAWAAFLIVFVTTLVSSFTATPLYDGQVQLLIEAENPNVVSFKEVIEQEKATNDYYQTQYRILQSRTLARRVLDRLNMWSEFEAPRKPRPTLLSLLAAPLGWAHLPAKTAPAEPPAADETLTQSRAIDAFLSRLTVAPVRNSRLVNVTFTSPQPELAANVANGLAQAYIEQNLEFRYNSSKEASDWLSQRLAEQRKLVEGSESALQRYREEHDAVSLEERQNIVVQKLADLNAAVTRAKTERIQKESAYNQVRALQSAPVGGIDSLPTILSNQFIQQQKNELADVQRQIAQLSDKFGDRHPDMVKLRLAQQAAESRIQGEVAKVMQSLKNDYDTALAQEQSLMRALEQQKQDALALNRKGIDYASLQRDAASNRQMYEALLQRTKETGIAGELRTSNVRVVDHAEVPQTPSSPNRRLNAVAGFLGGAMLAVACAFLFEYIDNRIRTPQEVKGYLGLPFLGIVPASAGDSDGPSPLLSRRVKPSFAEAMRTIRTNVLFSTTSEGAQALTVTSTRASEGKTLVSTNLALALAQTGQRVLLIDADMRLPRVHEVFGAPQEPGLSNVLTGETKTADAIRPVDGTGLWLLPAGYLPPNPAELLGSKRFQDFINTLNEHFNWIIIDTPPVMAVADAPIVAHITSAVVFVIGSEMTARNVARTAIEQLKTANARIIGAVLNKVDLEHNAYYYSQYYRREYGNYYVKTA